MQSTGMMGAGSGACLGEFLVSAIPSPHGCWVRAHCKCMARISLEWNEGLKLGGGEYMKGWCMSSVHVKHSGTCAK